MALALLSHVVADLTLGKPALPWLPATASVRDALAALKHLADDVTEISIWDCSPDKSFSSDLAASCALTSNSGQPSPCGLSSSHHSCLCIGKICMQNILCYLASEKCLCNLHDALDASVSTLLPRSSDKCPVQHIDPDASLLEVLDLLVGGVQNLVVPITRRASFKSRHGKPGMALKTRNPTLSTKFCLPKDHDGQEYCWLTHEDVLRFLLGSISVFSPLPMMSIEALGLLRADVRMVGVDQGASSIVEQIEEACCNLSAVAIVEASEDILGAVHLVGDISCSTLQACNETAALALNALSAGDFLVFSQDCGDPPQVLVDTIRTRVLEKLSDAEKQSHLLASKKEETNPLLQKLEMWEDSSSEDDESGADSPIGPHDLSRKWHAPHFRSSRKGFTLKSRSGPIFCNPKSSLIAVLLQALAHREHYVWVTEEDDVLIGIVTFKDILAVMLSHINVFN
ncbi:hypothetical protein GOP47_0020737 [Adiantum capillus-veneris]|uniref:CBS domain-containing protein n=1 Tax=Adiantum capillus-veneris TaxID=13818 RepID=A0A9D4UA38_ADICA|nr:hypothetical protein GOP47_0020737 [Adiantum capillus-veneris]